MVSQMITLIILIFVIGVQNSESYRHPNEIESHGMYFPMTVLSEMDAMVRILSFATFLSMNDNFTEIFESIWIYGENAKTYKYEFTKNEISSYGLSKIYGY